MILITEGEDVVLVVEEGEAEEAVEEGAEEDVAVTTITITTPTLATTAAAIPLNSNNSSNNITNQIPSISKVLQQRRATHPLKSKTKRMIH